MHSSSGEQQAGPAPWRATESSKKFKHGKFPVDDDAADAGRRRRSAVKCAAPDFTRTSHKRRALRLPTRLRHALSIIGFRAPFARRHRRDPPWKPTTFTRPLAWRAGSGSPAPAWPPPASSCWRPAPPTRRTSASPRLKTESPYFFVKSDDPAVDQLPLKATEVDVTHLGRDRRRHRDPALPQRRPARHRSEVRVPGLDQGGGERPQRAAGRPPDHRADPREAAGAASNTTARRRKARPPRCWSSTCPTCSR